MTTVEHKTDTERKKLSIPRRISEILTEKGVTIRGFSTRLNMSRETFRLIQVGERPASPAEVEEIAKALEIDVERLKQMDNVKQQQELESFFHAKRRTKPMMLRAEKIAKEVVEVSVGVTERGYTLHDLGRVQYVQDKFEEAHVTWLQTLQYANELNERYGEKHLLHLVTANLMLTSTILREYSKIHDLLVVVEEVFADDPGKLGMAQYTRMKMQEERGHIDLAKKHAYLSLELFQQTYDPLQIGTALLNVAHYEFLAGNYKECKELLGKAKQMVEHCDDILVHVLKNYVKTLMKLREYETAVQVVDEYASVAREYPEYWARLKIMYAVAKDVPSIADSIIQDSSLSVSVRRIASKCLTEYYARKGDSVAAMRYYEKVRIFSRGKSEYLDEEEL